MLGETVRRVLDRFPLDPPGELVPGNYVRISRRQTRVFGHLRDLVGPIIQVQQHDHPIEFLGGSATRLSAAAGSSVATPVVAGSVRSDVAFGSEDGLLIVGSRQTLRITNLDDVFRALAKAPVDWSVRNRIVVECQRVQNATIVCSSQAGNRAAVEFDGGEVARVTAEGSGDSRGLLRITNVTGTIAFAAMRYVRFLNIPLAGGGAAYETRDLDPNDPADAYDELEDGDSR